MHNYKARAVAVCRLAVRFFAVLGALLVLVYTTPLVSWWAAKLAGPWDDPKGDVLIVLGGSLIDPGLLGVNTYWRSVYALRAWREGGFHDIVLSGGTDSHPISILMADFLKCHGVPASAIHVETHSNSTHENAAFSKPLLDPLPGTKVLLTSDYHMYRSVRAFKKVGIDVLPRPFPDAIKSSSTWRGRWTAFLEVSMETVKIVYYRWKDWI